MGTQLERLTKALADRYTIEREIGSGGMATVYLAEDTKHHRNVALKVLHPELAAVVGPERFLREIDIAANLTHPHILPVFDSGEADGSLYYVMPYVEGESLRTRLDREKQLPLGDAVQISREIADALSFAHGEGVLHRDVKPANILMEAGHAVLADFGVAKAVAEAGDLRLTESRASLGTPVYMSPEQAAGERDLDGRSDQYALACVLYEMLAGQPPFTGPTVESIIGQHLTVEPASVTTIRSSVPGNVAAAISRALAKNPADRFTPTALFAEALAAASTAELSGTGPGHRSLIPLVLGAATIVIIAAVAALIVPGARPPLTLGRTAQLTFAPGLEVDAALSPDGKRIAYVTGPLREARLFVRQVGGGRAIELAEDMDEAKRRPKWSPDATTITYEAAGSIWRVPALGGPSQLLFSAPEGTQAYDAVWSPDGTAVAYVRGDSSRASPSQAFGTGIYMRVLSSGLERLIATTLEPHSLAWSPDGTRIAFVDGNSNFVSSREFANIAPSELHIVAVDGGRQVRLDSENALHMSPAWHSDDQLLFVSNRGGGLDIYVLELRPDGTPRADPVRLSTGLRAHSISIAGNGVLLTYAQVERRQNIRLLHVPRGQTTSFDRASPVTSGSQVIEGIAVSPDGEWIVFDSDRNGNQDLFKRRLGGGDLIRLTDHPADEFVNSWSADGRWLAGHGFRNGKRDAFVLSADGLLFEHVNVDPAHDRYPSLSPDGGRVVFQSLRAGPHQLFVAERQPGGEWSEPTQLTDEGGERGQFSPDGQLVAYLSGTGMHNRGSLRVRPAVGGGTRVLVATHDLSSLPLPVSLEWRSDGRSIVYAAVSPRLARSFWEVTLAGGPTRLLVPPDTTIQINRHEFALHGDSLYFTVSEYEADVYLIELEGGGDGR